MMIMNDEPMNETINPLLKEKALKIMDTAGGHLCMRCLGRNFSQDIEAADNRERGEYIRTILAEVDIKDHSKDYDKKSTNDDNCFVCHNLLEFMDNGLIENIIDDVKNSEIEFSTFLVGCRVPPAMIQRENDIYSAMGSDLESIKKEINREIGKALSVGLDKEVDFDNPNLAIVIDFTKNLDAPQLEIQINPLFIEGRYKKLIRGIPQTKWPCRECKGRGCERCNFTGKMYQESVEELISPEVLKEARGSESKFHGAGREDIDVKMLGNGRPFVLEIKEPRWRTMDLKDLEYKINHNAEGKVEVSALKFVNKERRSQIKTSSTDTYKVYRAKVDLDKEISDDDLKLLNSLDIIEQRTPQRVVHRRADIIRKRKIRDIQIKKVDQQILELTIECQGGLYVKELISGDEHRTQPSVSSLLQTPARCVQLDVLDVHLSS
jgi:tRNA pseudouridine synthase 10